MTLTKAHLIEALSVQIGYSKAQSVEMVETLLELIKGSLESVEDVLVGGFAKFFPRCINNKTGDIKTILVLCFFTIFEMYAADLFLWPPTTRNKDGINLTRTAKS